MNPRARTATLIRATHMRDPKPGHTGTLVRSQSKLVPRSVQRAFDALTNQEAAGMETCVTTLL